MKRETNTAIPTTTSTSSAILAVLGWNIGVILSIPVFRAGFRHQLCEFDVTIIAGLLPAPHSVLLREAPHIVRSNQALVAPRYR